jgi:hypothetical protein
MTATTTHNDRLLTSLLAQQASNRADAVGKIIHEARNAGSLEGLRVAIDEIAKQMTHIDCLHEEAYRRAERH